MDNKLEKLLLATAKKIQNVAQKVEGGNGMNFLTAEGKPLSITELKFESGMVTTQITIEGIDDFRICLNKFSVGRDCIPDRRSCAPKIFSAKLPIAWKVYITEAEIALGDESANFGDLEALFAKNPKRVEKALERVVQECAVLSVYDKEFARYNSMMETCAPALKILTAILAGSREHSVELGKTAGEPGCSKACSEAIRGALKGQPVQTKGKPNGQRVAQKLSRQGNNLTK